MHYHYSTVMMLYGEGISAHVVAVDIWLEFHIVEDVSASLHVVGIMWVSAFMLHYPYP